MSGVRDTAHIATWAALAITIAGSAMGYGALTQRVMANEEAVKDAKPVAARLATLEANQQALKSSVDAATRSTEETNKLLTQLLIELQRNQNPRQPQQ